MTSNPGTGYDKIRPLLVASISGFLLLILGSYGLVLWGTWQGTREDTGNRLLTLSQAITEQVEAVLRSQSTLLTFLQAEVSSRQNQGGLKEEDWYRIFLERLDKFDPHDRDPPLNALFAVDARGVVLSTSVALPSPKLDVTNRDYYQFHSRQKTGGDFISPITKSRLTGLLVFYLSQRMEDPEGNFQGVLLMSTRVEIFDELFSRLDLPEGSAITILTSEGAPLFRHPMIPDFETTHIGTTPLFQEMKRNRRGIAQGESPLDGALRIVGYSHGREYPIVVGVALTEPQMMELWVRSTLLTTGIVVLVLLGFFLLFRFTLRQIRLQEEALRQSVSAAAASQAKSHFLSSMSHEIRTPLNAVLGFSQLLTREAGLTDEGRKKLDIILQSGNHLLGLINDVLEMSRIESGRSELKPQVFPLPAFLKEIAAMFQYRTQQTGLGFQITLGPRLPLLVEGDEGRLRKILINLLGNAFKYTQVGGVDLSADWTEDLGLEVRVTDTGIGLSPEDLAQLFTPFHRTERGEKTASGTGLGLVISQQYAREMGGNIFVESRRDQGSCFTLKVPLRVVDRSKEGPPLPEPNYTLAPSEGSPLVLVIDDNDENRQLFQSLLKGFGFQAAVARSGEEGLAAMTDQVRLVLLDRRLPDGDGAAWIPRLKHRRPGVLVVGTSASVFPEEVQSFLRAGLDGFLPKPFTIREFREVLEKDGRFALVVSPTTSDLQAPSPVVPEEPEAVGEEWLNSLRSALTQGNISKLKKLAAQLKETHPQTGAWLLEKLGSYDLDSIRKRWSQGF